MTGLHRTIAPACLVLFLLCQTTFAAESAKSAFDSAFGDQIKLVRGTADPADDVDLATTMMGAAQQSKDTPELAILICENVIQLASRHPSGYPIAIEALELQAELQPSRRESLQQRALSLLEGQYRRASAEQKEEAGLTFIETAARLADQNVEQKAYRSASLLYRRGAVVARALKLAEEEAELRTKAEQYQGLSKIQQQVESTKAQLKTKPKNQLANATLVRLYTFELDDPATASQYLEYSGDEQLKVNVLLATQEVDALAPKTALDLGQWYETSSKTLSKGGKVTSLTRAKMYYTHAMATFDDGDLSGTKAKISLNRVDGELEKLQPVKIKFAASSGSKKNGVINLLKKIDVTKDRLAGSWSFKRNVLTGKAAGGFGGFGTAGIRAPVKVQGDYELEIQFARTAGDGPVMIILPVGERTVSFIMSQRDYSAFTRPTANDDRPATGGRRSAARRFLERREQAQNSTISGLYNIDDEGAEKNGTGVKGGLTNSRAYSVAIKVKTDSEEGETTISIAINKKLFTKWKGKTAALGSPDGLRALGIEEGIIAVGTSNRSTLAISRMLLKVTKGEVEDLAKDRTSSATDDNNPNANPENARIPDEIMRRLRESGLSEAEIRRRYEQMRRRRRD